MLSLKFRFVRLILTSKGWNDSFKTNPIRELITLLVERLTNLLLGYSKSLTPIDLSQI